MDFCGDDGSGAVAEFFKPGCDVEGGGFEVVDEESGELAGGGGGEFLPIGFFIGGGVLVAGVEGLVDVFGGAAVGGDDEDGEEWVAPAMAAEGRHDFAAAGAEGSGLADEEGDVAAEGRGDLFEGFIGEVEVPEGIEGDEGVCGVAASAAHAAAGGDGFVEGDAGGYEVIDVGGEGEGGSADEIFLRIGGDAFGAAGDAEFEGFRGFNEEGVVPGDGGHPGFDGVEAIGARGEDAQAEVELGGGVDAEAGVGFADEALM